jgi:hypothetical protein
MWNASKNEIPESQIAKHALTVLTEYAGEFEPGQEILDALAYLERKTNRKTGFKTYREGLRTGDAAKLAEGLALIRKHTGL